MTLGGTLGLSDRQERLIARSLQLVLVGLVGYGLVTRRPSVAGSAGLGFAVTLLPAWLNREYGYSMDAGLVLWITIAMLLHTIGNLGIYEQYPWFDEITHMVSATIVAALGYAIFRAFELYSNEIDVPSEFRAVFIVVFVLAAGMIWEVIEFAFGGLIPVYGVDDIVTDLIFNTVGAIVVAVWGTGYVTELVTFLRGRLRSNHANG